MATPNEITDAIVAVLESNLDDVDSASSTSYLPAIEARKVGLIAVANGHESSLIYATLATVIYRHRLRLQFWVKVVQGREETFHRMARDLGYQAMKVLLLNDGEGYELYMEDQGALSMTYTVEQYMVQEGVTPYLLGTLIVPVRQHEEAE